MADRRNGMIEFSSITNALILLTSPVRNERFNVKYVN